MSITFKEVLGKNLINDVPIKHQQNIDELLIQVNLIRDSWGRPMQVTSGYRSMQDHLRIYSEKAAKEGVPFDKTKVPMQSAHLSGEACDILDSNLELTQWLKDNPEELEKADLFCELGNKNWVHFQTRPFRSYKPGGTRWFNP